MPKNGTYEALLTDLYKAFDYVLHDLLNTQRLSPNFSINIMQIN